MKISVVFICKVIFRLLLESVRSKNIKKKKNRSIFFFHVLFSLEATIVNLSSEKRGKKEEFIMHF